MYYSIASAHGLPSLVKDDFVTLEALAAVPGNTPPWLKDIPRQTLDTLRIERFTDRVAQALGDCPVVPSGRLSGPSATSLFNVFSSDLTELQRSITSTDLDTTLRLHLCRIRFSVFELQTARTASTSTAAARTLAATDCYVSCMRFTQAVCSTPRDQISRWPISIAFGWSLACVRKLILFCIRNAKCKQICLIRLLSSEDGRALDMDAALAQITAVFQMANDLNGDKDNLRGRLNQLISFSVRDAHLRRSSQAGMTTTEEPPNVESRMGS